MRESLRSLLPKKFKRTGYNMYPYHSNTINVHIDFPVIVFYDTVYSLKTDTSPYFDGKPGMLVGILENRLLRLINDTDYPVKPEQYVPCGVVIKHVKDAVYQIRITDADVMNRFLGYYESHSILKQSYQRMVADIYHVDIERLKAIDIRIYTNLLKQQTVVTYGTRFILLDLMEPDMELLWNSIYYPLIPDAERTIGHDKNFYKFLL